MLIDWGAIERRSIAKRAARKATQEQEVRGESDAWMRRRAKKLARRRLKEYDDGHSR